LNRVSSGDLDAVVVARAGLARIGRLDLDTAGTKSSLSAILTDLAAARSQRERSDAELSAILIQLGLDGGDA